MWACDTYSAVGESVMGIRVGGGDDVVASENIKIDGSSDSTFDYLHVLTALRLSRHGRSGKGQSHRDEGGEVHGVC